jgi:hypothetical protein
VLLIERRDVDIFFTSDDISDAFAGRHAFAQDCNRIFPIERDDSAAQTDWRVRRRPFEFEPKPSKRFHRGSLQQARTSKLQ